MWRPRSFVYQESARFNVKVRGFNLLGRCQPGNNSGFSSSNTGAAGIQALTFWLQLRVRYDVHHRADALTDPAYRAQIGPTALLGLGDVSVNRWEGRVPCGS